MRNLKRALSLALASVMLVGMMVVGTGAASYPDVSSKNNLEAIEILKAVGIMTGDDKGNFNPDQKVTRNEMAVVMANLLDLRTGGTSPFTDVPAWAQPYVAACYNNGIIAGTTKTTYGGSADVTTAQAALMVMKTLGYFNYQGEFGDDWKIATIKQGVKIDLFDGINSYTDEPLTRNIVAKLVLNALQSDVCIVTEQGGLSVEGNGIAVNQKPTYTYADAQDKAGRKYDGINDGIQQLTEKLYGSDLKKNGEATDSFGRPCTEWTYADKSIKTAKAPAATYNDEVKLGAIYSDLGLGSAVAAGYVKFVTNGGTADAGNDNSSTPVALNTLGLSDADQSNKIGRKGTVTEVYYDRNADTDKVVVVMYNYFLAKATEDYDTSDKEVSVDIYDSDVTSATLKAADFAVTNVKEDDYLVVTIAGTTVKTVAPANVVENATVSSARANDYVVAGGTKYTYDYAARNDSDSLGYSLMTANGYNFNKDGYNLYVAPNGYVLGVDGYDAGVNLNDYVFVKSVSNNGFDAIAKVLFMDGTTKTVIVDKVDSTDVDKDNTNAITPNKFYKFDTDKDGNYELTTVATGSAGTVVKQNSATSAITSAANPVTGAPAGTSATVFIAKDKTYTGVKNAPEVASGTVYYMTNDKGRLMVVYTATAGSSKTSSDDLVYILNNNPAKAKDGDNTYYIYDAIVDGTKTTLEANQGSKAAGVYKLGTYTDGRADLDTALTGIGTDDALVNILGDISADGADYADGTLTLGTHGYLLADNAKIFTIDGNTVKEISASGVKKAVGTDNFKYAAAIEVSSSNDDIVVVYLSKTAF